MGDLHLPNDISEFTAEYLTTALQHSGHLVDGSVRSVTASPLGAGVGFVGQLARLEVEYAGDREDLPDVLIAKFPNADPMAKHIATLFGFFRTEAKCYQNARIVGLGVPTPKVFVAEVSDDDRDTLIVMEDLGDARMADQVQGASLADAQAVMDVAAQLHATWWESSHLDELTWLRPLNNPAYLAIDEQWDQSFPVFEERYGHLAPAGVFDAIRDVGSQLPDYYHMVMAERPTTLAHADFRLDNMFFDRPGAPVTVIDWQLSVRSGGMGDVGYFLVQSLDTSTRREHEQALLQRWHDGLLERGVTGYSWDDAIRDYREFVVGQLSIPVVGTANLDPANERGAAVWECMVQRSLQAVADHDLPRLPTAG